MVQNFWMTKNNLTSFDNSEFVPPYNCLELIHCLIPNRFLSILFIIIRKEIHPKDKKTHLIIKILRKALNLISFDFPFHKLPNQLSLSVIMMKLNSSWRWTTGYLRQVQLELIDFRSHEKRKEKKKRMYVITKLVSKCTVTAFKQQQNK